MYYCHINYKDYIKKNKKKMAVSKNRKDHKKKSQRRTEKLKTDARKAKQRMLEKYLEMQKMMMENAQKSGEVVENTDIDIDLNLDMKDDEYLIDDEYDFDPSVIVDEPIEYTEIIEEEKK